MTPGRLHLEEFLPVVAMESKLSEDLIALFAEGKDVGRVAIESTGHEAHIADELLVADQFRTQRPAEGEIRMEDLRHQRNVGVVPQFLVEDAHDLLPARPVD